MALALDHVALRTARLAETRRFLEAVLDLKPGPRPPVSVPGYWLYAGPHPIVHLMGVSAEAGAGWAEGASRGHRRGHLVRGRVEPTLGGQRGLGVADAHRHVAA